MDALKLRRTLLRTAFTKAVNHLQEIIENDPVDMNAVETAFEQLKVKSAKLKEVEDAVLELMIESNCTQEAYNIEFEAIEGYAEKMIAWQVRMENIMKADALGQKHNHSLVTSSSSSLRLPKIQFQQFSGELTDWLQVSSVYRIKLARNSFDSEKFNYKKKLGNLSTTATAADLFNSNFKNRKDFKFKNSKDNCIFCEKTHASENCCEAASMLYDVKKNAVIKRGVCYICLKRGHMSHSCRSDVKCIICNKRHYAVLCSKLPLRSGLETESASVENSTTASSSSSNVLANQACTSEVLLQTLVVVLQNGNHRSLVRALIDTGSQKSYILKSTAEKLAFKNEGEEEFIHSLFGGTKTKMYRHKCYKICLTNVDNNYTCNLNVYDQEMICNDVPSIRHGPWINELKNRKINLSDRDHNLGGKIEILIGADVAGKLLTGTMFYLKSGPVAIKTKLGWTLMGKTYRNKTKFDNNHFMNVTSMFVNDMCISDLWNLKDDCLSCKINCQKIEGKAITTKRSLLSIANPIFDPIGFTAPVTLKPKLILQEIWKLKLKWDENLPENILNQVKQWLEQLPILAGIKIPRCLNLSSNGIKQIALHVFCGASKKAYAACVFLRVEYEENVFVKLIQAKARVAPLKDISIPRLELLSCTLSLGTRLAASVKNDLNLPDVRIYYLTDSMTALAWIQRTRDWGVFVFNRVKEIRNLSDVSSWEHVLSEKNFADILTRGCSAQQLIYLRWWEGEPPWLSENPVQCPKSKQVPDENAINLELRKSVLVNTAKRSLTGTVNISHFT
ncbi:integrase catalytic domain-containing protein [Trichonephila inaurata madagascariensis]|uniref:Integrase catalytic domain-containing protein n=1 Tax=Trichonephila inaurata madagascariensis TaxID=2747483 RepID=A0A8X6M7M9_9ARAC|nr:integrase catalytic domain-containing protein [Trichonephila inaurata madagascariensis]